jgi:hypothetical protein
MRKTRVWITSAVCLFVVASVSHAQKPPIQPGLYETTSSMTFQKSPFPPGMQMPPQAAAAFGGGPHTTQSCLTQAWIDRFGGPIPQSRGDCHMNDMSMSATGMTATLVCTGQVNGSGDVKIEWSMGGSAKGKIHFSGSMQMGPNPTQIEWTNEFSSTYKGPDCGSVKPMQMPADK